MKKTLTLVIIILVAVLSIDANAKAPDDQRITELEKQLVNLQKTYLNNNQEAVSAVARAASVQDEFAAVKGQVEAVDHQLRVQKEEYMRLIQDLQTRLQAIEESMGNFSGGTDALSKGSSQITVEAEGYQKALALANRAQYLEAASAFESFLQKYPKSPQAPSAKFWVAECFYSVRDYKRAIKEFQAFIEKNSRNPKVPEAILKQGNSFYELQLLDEAKAFYQKVIQAYPSSIEASQAKTKLSRIEAKKSSKAESLSSPGTSGSQGSPANLSNPSIMSGTSSYPTETVVEQRQKMLGKPATTGAEQSTTTKEKKRPAIPQREF